MARMQVENRVFADMQAAFDVMNQGCLLLDRRRRVAGFNTRLAEFVGVPSRLMLLGAEFKDLIEASAERGGDPRLSMADVQDLCIGALDARAPTRRLVRRPDGRTLKIGAAPFGAGGRIVIFEDVSALAEAEKAVVERRERFDVALNNVPHGVCIFDADKRLVLCNKSYAALYRLPPELAIAGTPLQRILDHRTATDSAPINMTTYFQVDNEAEAAGDAGSGGVDLRDGRTIRITHAPMIGGGYVATHEDITATVRAEEEIRHLRSHDPLTGLPNTSLLRDRIGAAVRRVKRGEMFAIHYLAVDFIKHGESARGQWINDLLLKQVAKRLRGSLRNEDTLCRIAADQFVVLQGGLKKQEQAARLARRIAVDMADPFDLDGHREVQLGVNVGVAVCPADGTDADTLLKNANIGLSRSKSEGLNISRFFDRSMDSDLRERRQLEFDLRRAIVKGEFEVYYQPQVNALTEVITGCEALVRWHHPSRGIVPPGDFIPVAEQLGIIGQLGAWVIQQACRDASTWPKAVGVAVNLSSAQFMDLSLFQTVLAALGASNLSPPRLELEITESALLTNSESNIQTLEKLRALGIRIAMDDFGIGYSSLSYLRVFPFDKLKIDRSFIKDIDIKSDCSAIVRAVAALGAELGMTVTAEGVETLDQLRLVRDHGCNEAQGYFFGRPCPASAIRTLFGSEYSGSRTRAMQTT